MTSRAHWKIVLCAGLISGCQSVRDVVPWQVSGQQTYTADELASLNDPQPAAARPQLSTAMHQSAGSVNATTVSASNSTNPVAAGQLDQLIKSGQSAIRDAGQGDPSKLQEARQIFDQVLAADAGNSSAHHGLAIVADLQQDWRSAEDHYKRALQQRPQDPSLLNDLGYSYVLQNRFHEANNYLTQAIQLSPQHERAHINLALLSLKRGDRNGAQASLASIYSPSEVNRTLAQLEQDLQQRNSTTSAQFASANQQPGAAPQQNFGAPQNFPQQNFTAQNPAQPMNGAPNGFVNNNGSPQNYSSGMVQPQNYPPVARQAEPEKPIHIYPPGFSPEPAAPATAAFNPGAYSNATYPGNAPPVGFATHANPGAYPNNANGVPVGGIIATPNNGQPNQFQSYPANTQYYQGAAGSPNPTTAQTYNGTMYPTAQSLLRNAPAINQAPVAGLNAGPGSLFPVGTPGAVGSGNSNYQVPAPQPNPQNYQQAPPSQYPPGVMNFPQQQQQQFGMQPTIATVSSQQPMMNNYGAQQQYQMPNQNQMPTVPGTNRMQAYEQQLQRLDGQYNQAVQQLNGSQTVMYPAATR